jgi:lipid A ethanolaminephosphotransferase
MNPVREGHRLRADSLRARARARKEIEEVSEFKPRRLAAAALVGAASLWMATAGNAPLWRELQALGLVQAQGGWLLTATLAGMLAAVLFALLSLLSWRGVLKPALILLLFTTALGGHFMWSYRVIIDSGMATNTLQTDWLEVRGLLTPQLGLVALLGGLLPAWLVWRAPVAWRPWKQQLLRNFAGAALGLVLAVAFLLLSFQPMASTMRNHKQLRYLMNPLNSLYAVGHSAFGNKRMKGGIAPLGRDAKLLAADGARPRLLVLVLGETGRSGNFGINGYPRDTTPELARAQAVSFRNAWSCGTSTAASVPCMFSHLGRDAFQDRAQDSENLLDVLQHAGLAVLWIDNQPGGCKGVCDRVPTVNTSALKNPQLCPRGECHDEILLAGLDERLAALPAAQRARGVVLVMHQMGSHGPAYSERTPPAFKRFQPECTSKHLPDCSSEQLRNAYDNTIAYTDHVLGSTLRWIGSRADYDGALLYVSDHGESLGENNLYLHGLPYALAPDVQKHVPWVTWLAPGFEQRTGITMQCLRARADARITHDNLFHSVLGLMQVGTSAYRRPLDAYAGCGGQ